MRADRPAGSAHDRHFQSSARFKLSRRSRRRQARRSKVLKRVQPDGFPLPAVKSRPASSGGGAPAALEDLLQVNPCQDPNAPPNWESVATLVDGAIEHGCSVFEPRFLELAEQVENQVGDNTLEWWLCSHLLDCVVTSASPVWAKSAALDLLSRQGGINKTSIRVLSANVTCWVPKIKDWILGTIGSWEVLCIQETHLLNDIPEVEATLSSASLSHHFGPGQRSDKGGVLGGVLSIAPAHRNTRRVVEVLKTGCGFVGDELRLQGWSLVIFNFYLKSGSSLQGEINSWVLSKFLSLVQGLGVPWIAVGDFNVPVDDFDSTSIPSEAKAELVSPSEPTTDHGAILDYALVSRGLSGSVAISVCWDVPFKPHGLLQLSVEGSCDMPFPQLPRYKQVPDKPVRPFLMGQIPSQVSWDGQRVKDPASCKFAAWSAAVGLAFDITDGPGTEFTLSRAPLIRTHSPSRIWVSGDLAFWDRLGAWARRVQQKSWAPAKMSKPVKALLSEVPSHWQHTKDVSLAGWCSEAERIFSNIERPSQA